MNTTEKQTITFYNVYIRGLSQNNVELRYIIWNSTVLLFYLCAPCGENISWHTVQISEYSVALRSSRLNFLNAWCSRAAHMTLTSSLMYDVVAYLPFPLQNFPACCKHFLCHNHTILTHFKHWNRFIRRFALTFVVSPILLMCAITLAMSRWLREIRQGTVFTIYLFSSVALLFLPTAAI